MPEKFEQDSVPSSASVRVAVVSQQASSGNGASVEYVADLRRNVLLGALKGYGEDFEPVGPDLLIIRQSPSAGAARRLLKPHGSTTSP